MSEKQKELLEQQLWNIANTLRGKMTADEFCDYILNFIFYKYQPVKIFNYPNELFLDKGIVYNCINESTEKGHNYLKRRRDNG
jgi:type I restriction enzyme M protein